MTVSFRSVLGREQTFYRDRATTAARGRDSHSSSMQQQQQQANNRRLLRRTGAERAAASARWRRH